MNVKTITTDDLRRMKDYEGLILQGCGGSSDEWVDGINDMLTEEGILLEGSKFENCSVFKHNDLTCMLFPFEGVKLDTGKLAMWRLKTHGAFGGTWLSDFVPNKLGGFLDEQETIKQESAKPDCPLIGRDGNILNLMGIAARTLRRNGMSEQATEMIDRVQDSGSYHEALGIIGEYINITSVDDEDLDEGMEMDLC